MYNLLEGLRVLDFSQYWPDAVGQYMADLGAEVIKVENARGGSLTRYMGDLDKPNLDFMHWNRGKRSFAVDLKLPQGVDTYLALARTADVVIDGLRAEALDRLGVGYEGTRAVNPAVVYIALSGWGSSGPYKRLATHGMGFDAFAGFREPVPDEDGAPQLDMTLPEMSAPFGCLYAVQAALAALFRRSRTGEGAYVDVSEGEAGTAYFYRDLDDVLNPQWEDALRENTVRTRYQYYPTKDGKVIIFMAIEEKFWLNFCNAVKRSDLVGPPRRPGTLVNYGSREERAELTKIFRTKTRAEWVEFFIQNDIAGGPRNSLADVVEDPHFRARGGTVVYRDPRTGPIPMLGTPIKVRGQQFSVGRAPNLGEHTDEILRSLGYSEQQIQELRDLLVINAAAGPNVPVAGR